MKSKRLAVSAAVLAAFLAVGYTGSAWYFGKQIEAAHAQIDTRIAAVPYFKLVRHDYERGLFSASEVITLELAPALFQLPAATAGDQADAGDTDEPTLDALAPDAADSPQTLAATPLPPIQVTIKSIISHGPFPGFASLAAGRAESTVVFDDAIQKKLDGAFAGKPAVSVDTLYQISGGGRAQVSSPAFKTEVTNDKTGRKATLSGDGVEMTVNFTRDFEQYDVQGNAPRFTVADANGAELVFSGFGVEARQKRVFADEPNFYAGSAQLSLAGMSILPGKDSQENAPTVGLKNLVYAVDVPLTGEYVDLIGKISADEFKVSDRDYGPVHYDFSLKHLNARKLASLNRKMMALYSSPDKRQDPTQLARIFEPLKEPLLDVLVDNPRFNIDRLSFRTADGDAALSATLGLTSATLPDFANPLSLLTKIDLTADLAFPATLPAAMQSGAAVDATETAARQQAVEQSIATFVQQGYATNEAGMIKSKAVFDGKQLLLNGRPFNPLSLAQSQQ